MLFSGAQYLNVFLRIFAMGSRFFLFSFLIFFLEPKYVGEFGVITAGITYFSMLIGLDLYHFSNREFAQSDKHRRDYVFSSIVYWYFSVYLAAGIILLSVVMFGNISTAIILPFFILILEHLNQELYRFIILLKRNILATLLLIVRSSAWVYIIFILFLIVTESRHIEIILYLWLISTITAATIGIFAVTRETDFLRLRFEMLKLIRYGLRISVPIFVGSIFLRSLFFFDRILFEKLNGAYLLGPYVFFAGMAAMIPSIAEAAIFSFYLQKSLAAGAIKSNNAIDLLVKQMLKYLVILSGITSLGTTLGLFFLYFLPVNSIYFENWPILLILVISNLAFTVSAAFNLGLYSLGLDNQIVFVNISTAIVFGLSCLVISNINNYLAVPVSILFAFVFLLVAKFHLFKVAILRRELP